jgi:predicted DsbA family dithiol-disulfide isomerase
MTSTPTLHVWHDYVCPFSYVAATRVMRIKEAEGLDLDVRFHPWPLEAANGTQPTAEYEDQWVRLLLPREPGAFAGWHPASGFWPASSGLLFAAYEAALDQSITAAARFDLLVRQAIFHHPRPIDSVDILSELAAAVGLDVDAFATMLESGIAERRADAADAEAKRAGVRGIPTFVLPDGGTVLNPGLKIQRTDHATSVRDECESLQALLHSAARADTAGTSRR